jgi:RNA polymerase sigma-70 factor (ECF subfamily)
MMNSLAMPSALYDDCTDADLVKRTLDGDDAAFAHIMRRHNRLMFRSARSILKGDDDTEEAVQEAYLHAWRSLSGFRAEAKLSTWLVRIAVNEALSRLRQRTAHVVPITANVESPVDNLETSMPANPDEQPDHLAMRMQVRQQIEARIDALPEVFRSVFVLRGVEELNVHEVALMLDLPEATVRSRFFRARGLLREGLSRDIDMAIGDAFSFAGKRCDRIVANVLAKRGREREFSRS